MFCAPEVRVAQLAELAPALRKSQMVYLDGDVFYTTINTTPFLDAAHFVIVPKQHVGSFAQIRHDGAASELLKHLGYIDARARADKATPCRHRFVYEVGQVSGGHATLNVVFTNLRSQVILERVIDALEKAHLEYRELIFSDHDQGGNYLTLLHEHEFVSDYCYFRIADLGLFVNDRVPTDFFARALSDDVKPSEELYVSRLYNYLPANRGDEIPSLETLEALHRPAVKFSRHYKQMLANFLM